MTEIFNDIVVTLTTATGLQALFSVIMIDLVLAGDNAIVIGLAAAGLPPQQRSRAILIGILAATVLRIAFAAFTIQLLEIVGLLLAGGILLLWVCWKMWRELRNPSHAPEAGGETGAVPANKTLAQAAWQIVIADISMSLDNVLAVAGAAREHPAALVFGLGLSIVMMVLPQPLSPSCSNATAGLPMSALRSFSMSQATWSTAALSSCGRS